MERSEARVTPHSHASSARQTMQRRTIAREDAAQRLCPQEDSIIQFRCCSVDRLVLRKSESELWLGQLAHIVLEVADAGRLGIERREVQPPVERASCCDCLRCIAATDGARHSDASAAQARAAQPQSSTRRHRRESRHAWAPKKQNRCKARTSGVSPLKLIFPITPSLTHAQPLLTNPIASALRATSFT